MEKPHIFGWHYDACDVIVKLLNLVDKRASSEEERRSIIELNIGSIGENILAMATTTEQAHAMIDEVADKLERWCQEARDAEQERRED